MRNIKMKYNAPDYIKIYTDLIIKRFPEKLKEYESLLQKEQLSILEVITLNEKIFGIKDKKTVQFNQSHRAYDKFVVLQILKYQKENNLNNSQLSIHFNISRNTIAKWKNYFIKRQS